VKTQHTFFMVGTHRYILGNQVAIIGLYTGEAPKWSIYLQYC